MSGAPRIDGLPDLRLLLSTPEGVEVFGFESGDREPALTWWHRLRADHAETGLWPVIMDRFFPERMAWIYANREYVAALTRPDPRDEATMLAELLGDPLPTSTADQIDERIGTWPQAAAPIQHAAFHDHSGRPVAVFVALVPAVTGSHVPGVLHFGAFGRCPFPAVHVAVLRHWEKRFGAELATMTVDSLEFVVERPPTTRAEAIALAIEHSCYSDGPFEAETLAELAASLLDAPIWLARWE
jgi:hypothetical protein